LDNINNTQPSAGITSFVRANSLPSSSGEYYGETISGIAGDNISVGMLISLIGSTHTWYPTDSSLTPYHKTNLLGICLNNAGNGDPITVLLKGFVVTGTVTFAPGGFFTPGQPLWLLGSNGRMTDVAPGGGQDRIVGHSYEDLGTGFYTIRFNPDNYWI
jgi:hypothetical protein